MSAFPLFRADGLTKRFGEFVALDRVDFDVSAGERVGLIGPNGSGKSTLVGCASGALRNDAGAISFKDRRIDRLPAHQRVRTGLSRAFPIAAALSRDDHSRGSTGAAVFRGEARRGRRCDR